MVEVAPQRSEISIRYWKYLVFLAIMALLGLLGLWYVLGSQWGARNSFAEIFRRYLSRVNRFRPTAKPEDNLASALRIHGLEDLGGNRYALLFSATNSNGGPIVSVLPTELQVKAGSDRASLKTVAIERVTPLHLKTSWSDRVSFASVMDYSGSMFPEDLQAIEQNCSAFINKQIMPFSAAVVKFNNSVHEMLPLSTNKSDIETALKKSISLENTALYQGIDKGMDLLQPRPHLRFLLLTTDGNDNASGVSLEDVIRRARQHYLSVFVLGFGWLNVDVLKRIAEESDGYYVYVPDSAQLKDWFPKLADIVNNVQAAEFTWPGSLSRAAALELQLTVGGTTLTRVR